MPAIEDLSYQDYLRILRRRWKLGAVLGLIGAAGGLALARVQTPTPTYGSATTVTYDPFRGFEASAGTVPPEQSRDLSGQLLLIRGTHVLGNAARRLGMIPADTPREKLAEYQPAISRLGSVVGIQTDPAKRSDLVRIQAFDSSPQRAADIANAVAEAYKEENLYVLTQFIQKRRSFLEREIGENEDKLNRAQLAFEQFRREHPLAAIEPGQWVAGEEAKVRDLAGRVEETRRQLELVDSGRPVSDLGLIAIVGAKSTTRLTQLSTQYTTLQLQKSQMLDELTEVHPAVMGKQRQIERVRQQLGDELSLILEAFEKQQSEAHKQAEGMRKLQESVPVEAQQLAHIAHEVHTYENLGLLLGGQLVDTSMKDLGISGQVQVISAAQPLPIPINPPAYFRFGALGAAGGLFAGLAIGILLETSRFSLRHLRDLESSLELPVLGINPRVTPRTMASWLPGRRTIAPGTAEWSRTLALANLAAPRSSMSEATRALRAGLQGAIDRGQTAFTVCGTTEGEGATTTAINLALSFAQAGKRVLLVEADLRSPSISRILGVQSEPGFSDLLLQSTDLDKATRNVADFLTGALTLDQVLMAPGTDQFHVVPCGKKTGAAVELLSSAAFSALLESMRARYDVVLFDSPPVSGAADAILLGKQTAVIVVFSAAKTDAAHLESTVLQLRTSDCRVVGLFVNAWETEEAGESEAVPLA